MLRFGAVSNSKSSNGRKIARMARNLTIFGPNRSRRRELKFEKFSNKRANKRTNELYIFCRIFFRSFSVRFRSFLSGRPDTRFSVAFEFDSNCQALWGAWQFESNSNASLRRHFRSKRRRDDRKRRRDDRKRRRFRSFRRDPRGLDLNYRFRFNVCCDLFQGGV